MKVNPMNLRQSESYLRFRIKQIESYALILEDDGMTLNRPMLDLLSSHKRELERMQLEAATPIDAATANPTRSSSEGPKRL